MPDKMERANELPKAILFDVDGTLSHLRLGPTPEILEMLKMLLQRKAPIAIVTGGSFRRINQDYLEPLKAHMRSDNCYVFVDGGAECYLYDGTSWKLEYQHKFSDEEREKIKNCIVSKIQKSPKVSTFSKSDISLRASKIIFNAIPGDTPEPEKDTWIGDGSTMRNLKRGLEALLPDLNIHVDGPKTTALVFTKKGVDKAYAVKWLATHLDIDAKKMLFVGDGFAEDGNDRQALPSGVTALRTSGPEHTKRIIDKLTRS